MAIEPPYKTILQDLVHWAKEEIPDGLVALVKKLESKKMSNDKVSDAVFNSGRLYAEAKKKHFLELIE